MLVTWVALPNWPYQSELRPSSMAMVPRVRSQRSSSAGADAGATTGGSGHGSGLVAGTDHAAASTGGQSRAQQAQAEQFERLGWDASLVHEMHFSICCRVG